ncbi:MAG TPA: hypothetical protein VGU45_15115 [Microvirga sp.]|nr:hypothetical protein [Microvirga sp.]
MIRVLTLSTFAVWALTTGAFAGNTSSNSSSNSSNGVHTRVDTIVTDDGRGRRIEERRVYRREAPPYRSLRQRRIVEDDD